MNTRKLVQAAVIAALYAVLTKLFEPISYGPVQFRLSEMLTVLPYLTPVAIPGLTLGTLIANLLGPIGIHDVIFGTLATLIAAYLTWRMSNPYLAPLPPAIVNPLIVGAYLSILFRLPYLLTAAQVFVGEAVVVYFIGLPLLLVLRRNPAWLHGLGWDR